jgi:membrane protein implicated in regulation of membrane protease activity
MRRLILPIGILVIVVVLIVAAVTMNWLNNLFIGCFVFGLVFTLGSFFLGDTIGDMMGGHGADIGHGAHHDGVHGDHAGGLLWFNFNSVILFLTWFGAAGFIALSAGLNALAALPIAIVTGVVGYILVTLFINKVLRGSETPYMEAQDYQLMGTTARVTNTIFEGGIGEIVYTKFGTTRSESARSTHGKAIAKGTEVLVLRHENGVAYVEELKALLADTAAEIEKL